jgi:3,4-dihydroxy 2-butanone 4-phosphate synthase/GTP cyclohydrolase II
MDGSPPMNFHAIEAALAALQKGDIIVVVDDIHRENEGDLVMAAQFANASSINTMIHEGGGLICVPLLPERAQDLDLPLMIQPMTDPLKTAFTVSVDAIETGTGISAHERAFTIAHLADVNASAQSFKKPGHIFPLIGKPDGVLVRPGHTEAAIDLCRLAGLTPVGVICEILNADGTMARRPDLQRYAHEKNRVMITIEKLIAYRKEHPYA